jgi:hypothetical protein
MDGPEAECLGGQEEQQPERPKPPRSRPADQDLRGERERIQGVENDEQREVPPPILDRAAPREGS